MPEISIVDLDATSTCSEIATDSIGLGRGFQPDRVIEIALTRGLSQIVQESSLEVEKELLASAIMLRNPELFMTCPISTVLSPKEAGPLAEKQMIGLAIDFSSYRMKDSSVEAAIRYLKTVSGSATFIADASVIVDELITNASLNAPKAKVRRRGEDLDDVVHEKCRLFMGRDEKRLLIGCEDPYGSLELPRLLARLRECYINGPKPMLNSESGGAGIGSYFVYRNSISYYVAVEKGMRTVVCCVLPTQMSSRGRAMIDKNLHLVVF